MGIAALDEEIEQVIEMAKTTVRRTFQIRTMGVGTET
jgi:hypothetical protein